MDIETQQPIGIVDASLVTFMRTGAAGAIGAKYLARKSSEIAVIVGAGTQGRAQLLGLSLALPNLKDVHFFAIDCNNAKRISSNDFLRKVSVSKIVKE
ncbi:UNVERIFIED_CONTAM: ornithine cyclodeaminase/alanine dehydrogenase-like protein (mu-crystallin family) [Brevibacillus sp. OAP136]